GSLFLPTGRLGRVAGADRDLVDHGSGRRLCRAGAQDGGECRLMERQSPAFTVFIYACAILLAAIILAPVLWLFIMSISPPGDLAAKPLRWWPQHADFSRYGVLLSTAENSTGAAFTSSLRNSIEIAGMATLAALALAIPAGWAVSRTPSVGWSLSMVIATYMLPPVA